MTVLTVLGLLTSLASAETADEVVAKARKANQVNSAIQSVTMTIVGKSGGQRVKELELKSKRSPGVSHTFMLLVKPSDEAGVKVLMTDREAGADEQMVYMPSIGRLNRISGNSRKGPFLSSDFTFEDLDIREAADGKHTMVDQAGEAWVIDTVPPDSPQYAKIRTHITKSDLVARKIEFYDRKGELYKTLSVERTAQSGNVTLPVKTKMMNHQRGTHTVLEITAHKLNVTEAELPSDTFTAANLERK